MGRGGHQGAVAQIARAGVAIVACLTLANCASKVDPKYGVSSSPRVVNAGEPVPKGGGTYRVGKPYVVAGRTYVPEENINYRAEGIASWYGDDFHGRLTANGEVFDMHSISAAHPTLPMPSYVRVTNLANRKSIVVRVNDRGPYAANRVIDLSVRAAKLLGFHDNGLGRVRVEYVGRAPTGRLRRPPACRDACAKARPRRRRQRSGSQRRSPSCRSRNWLPRRPLIVRPICRKFPPRRRLSAMSGNAARSAGPRRTAAVRVEAMALPPATAGYETPSGADVDKPMVSPVSAFAPTRYDAPAAFLSGRGLY